MAEGPYTHSQALDAAVHADDAATVLVLTLQDLAHPPEHLDLTQRVCWCVAHAAPQCARAIIALFPEWRGVAFDPNARSGMIGMESPMQTLLAQSMSGPFYPRYLDCLRLLLELGGDPNVKVQGCRPLCLVYMRSNRDDFDTTSRMLIDYGADVSTLTDHWTHHLRLYADKRDAAIALRRTATIYAILALPAGYGLPRALVRWAMRRYFFSRRHGWKEWILE
jgi:hypothetical protein